MVLQVQSIETELQILATKEEEEKEENVSQMRQIPGVWNSIRYC